MCRIWPMHLIILYLLALCPMWVHCLEDEPKLKATFTPAKLQISVCEKKLVDVTIKYMKNKLKESDIFYVWSLNNETASAKWTWMNSLSGQFEVSGNFIGSNPSMIGLIVNISTSREKEIIQQFNNKKYKYPHTYDFGIIKASGSLPVTVVGEPRKKKQEQDNSCIVSVAVFVSLMFIFLGCDMNWPTAKKALKRPIGLVIGMVGRFLFLPLISFWLGPVIFPESLRLRMILFFTGVSPVCGTASIWTLILEGNLDLSLLMTCIFMFSSIVLMPVWLFYIGPVLFSDEIEMVPYWTTAKYSESLLTLQLVLLMAPFALGICMQTWTPRLARFIVFVLENFFTALFLLFMLLLCSIICTILAMWDMSLTPEVYKAGMLIPWTGFLFGYLVMRICMQTHYDALAISLVTGILNTSIPILIFQNVESQSGCDHSTVLPLAMAIMTPIPLVLIFVTVKIMSCIFNRKHDKKNLKKKSHPYSKHPSPSSVPLMSATPSLNRFLQVIC